MLQCGDLLDLLARLPSRSGRAINEACRVAESKRLATGSPPTISRTRRSAFTALLSRIGGRDCESLRRFARGVMPAFAQG